MHRYMYCVYMYFHYLDSCASAVILFYIQILQLFSSSWTPLLVILGKLTSDVLNNDNIRLDGQVDKIMLLTLINIFLLGVLWN